MAPYRIPGFALNALRRVNMHIDRLYRREIQNVLEYYNDEDSRARYRFGKNTIAFIVNLVHDKISLPTKRSFSISATEQILIMLRFLATGSFLQVTGDTFAALHKSTVSRVVRRVCLALSCKLDQFVKFPRHTTGER